MSFERCERCDACGDEEQEWTVSKREGHPTLTQQPKAQQLAQHSANGCTEAKKEEGGNELGGNVRQTDMFSSWPIRMFRPFQCFKM